MADEPGKYRVQREKAPGGRERSHRSWSAAILAAVVVTLGLGGLALPRLVDYLNKRNLDDAVYKLADSVSWPTEVVKEIGALPGVRIVASENRNTRLVVTFDRTETDTAKLDAFFARQGVPAELLNSMSHRQRMSLMREEGTL